MQDEIKKWYFKYFGYELEVPFTVEAEIGNNWFNQEEV